MHAKIAVMLPKHMHVLCVLLALLYASASAWAGMGDNELINAAGNGNLARVKALLGAKVNVNLKTDDGITPLIAASENGHEDVVQALLGAKADVNAKAGNGSTALMRASQRGHQQVVKELLAGGADVNARRDMMA